MSHSFKKISQKEILHQKLYRSLYNLSFTTHFTFWFFLFLQKATTLQRHE